MTPCNKKVDKPFRRNEIGHYTFYIYICFVLAIVLYDYFYKRPICHLYPPLTSGLLFFIVFKAKLILDELFCSKNSFLTSLKLAIQPSSLQQGQFAHACVWVQLIFVVFGITQLPSKEVWFQNGIDISVLFFTIMTGVCREWHDCALLESYMLEKPFSYSGGSAMAFSFYYGYLNLIAPGLVKRIEVFRDREGITDSEIPHKKLYILLPSSSYVFDKLEGYQQQTKSKDLKIEHVGEKFYHHKQDRGLVKGRTYKNTMYIVEYSKDEKYYILLEGATPLKTYYETCKEHKEFERNKKEVVTSFYVTLKTLIKENREMKDIVKLIYYDDESSEITIPDIVRNRILKRKCKRKGINEEQRQDKYD